MKSIKSLAIASAFLLTGGIALAAPAQHNAGTPPQTKNYQAQNMNNSGGTRANSNAKVYEQKGTVTKVSDTSLVLLHRVHGKEKRIDFKVTSNTKRQGMVDKGSQVAVFYRTKHGERIATMVKAENWKG